MKKLLVVALLISSVSLQAQTVEFIEPRNVQGVSEAEFSTFTVGDNYYVLQKRFRMMAPVMYDLQLDAYDAARKPIGSNSIDKTLEMGDANIYEGIFPMKDRLVMFKSEYSKASGSKMSYLWYYPFTANGTRQKKQQLLTINAESAANSGNFGVNASPDGTKVAVISELPYEKEGMEKCVVTVFDNQFKQLWKKEYVFPYESSKAPKNEIFVNNEGVAFILKRIAVKKAFDQFSVFTFNGNGATVTEKKIELENGFTISTWKNLFTTAGDLQIAGYFYMDKKVGINVEVPDGTFLIEVKAATGDLSASKFKLSYGTVLHPIQLFRTPDNGLLLVGESMITNSTPKPGAAFEYNYDYKAGNVHFTKMDAGGTVQWNYDLRKDMRSAGDGGRFLGSYTWLKGNDINVLYLDEWSRHDGKGQFIEFGSRRVNVVSTIGMDGKPKSESVIMDQRIAGKKGEYTFIPSTGSLNKDNNVFLLAARGLELVGATIRY